MRYRGEIRPTIRRGSIREFFGSDPALKGCWSLNGHTRDESGNGNHGTVTGALPYFPFFHGYKFNGSSDYISLGNVLNIGTTDFSYIFWMQTTTTATSMLINKYVSDPGHDIYLYTGKIYFRIQIDANNARGILTNRTFNDGCLNCVVITCLRSTHILLPYVNGKLVSFSTIPFMDIGEITGNADNIDDFNFARRKVVNSYLYYSGFQGEIGRFNRVLSSAEISQYYQWAIATPRKYWFYSPEIITTGGLLTHPSRDDGYNRRIHGGYIR